MIGLQKREEEIIKALQEDGELTVSSLSRRLQVSVVTVRADLKSLEGKGLLVRTRGGAIPAYHPDILDKMKSHQDAKERIARKAAELIGDNDRVMITNGTTSALIGKYLYGKRNLQVVTNSTLLFPYARVNPQLQLTVVGGEFRASADALVGPAALRQLEQFHGRMTIAGTDGFTLEHGLTTHLVENAEMVRKMIESSLVKVLATDSSKYGKTGFVKILPLQGIDIIITDHELPEEAQKRIQDAGITLMLV